MDLEKAYYRMYIKVMWKVLQMYAGDGVKGKASMGKSKARVMVRGGKEFRCGIIIEAGLCRVTIPI